MKFSKKCIALATIILLILTVIGPAAWVTAAETGNTYYVSPSGSDENPGTQDQPWKALGFASKKAVAGDIVYAREGTYPNDDITPTASGTLDKPITFMAYPGEIPVITGSSPKIETISFKIGDGTNPVSNVIVDGFVITDITSTGTAIAFGAGNLDITLRNLTVKRTFGGMLWFRGCTDITIENCVFDTEGTPDTKGWGDNAIVGRDSKGVLIQNNYIARTGYNAIYFREASDSTVNQSIIRNNIIEQHWGNGIGMSDGCSYNIIENNTIYYAGEMDSGVNYGIWVGGPNNIIRKNVIVKTGAKGTGDIGIAIRGVFMNRNQNPSGNKIYNNIVYKCGGTAFDLYETGSMNAEGNKVLNNIFYSNRLAGRNNGAFLKGNFYLNFNVVNSDKAAEWKDTFRGTKINNNIILHANAFGDQPEEKVIFTTGSVLDETHSTWEAGTLTEFEGKYPAVFSGNLMKNPGFINAGKGNFKLRRTSSAIDAGAHLTKVAAAVTNVTEVTVENAGFFSDGYGRISGDSIIIGNNKPVTVSFIDYETNTLTLEASVTVNAGDNVDLAYAGKAPDIGAFEYGMN